MKLKDNKLGLNKYYESEKKKYRKIDEKMLESLKQMLDGEDIINGDLIRKLWFSDEIFSNESYIFISHSRDDKELAISLAGYIDDKFGIPCFIDSCVWGHMDVLNKVLNDCDLNENSIGECHNCNCNSFSRNLSYVHMMLASSLMNMIDGSECIFFLNTDASINNRNKLESPWIFYELNVADVVEKRTEIVRPQTESVMHFDEYKKVEFSPNLNKMPVIDSDIIEKWVKEHQRNRGNAFEELYKVVMTQMLKFELFGD